MSNKVKVISAVIAALAATTTLAAVSAEDAKQLGSTLTVVGAEKAGNKEGTIPAYTGERIKIPSGYDPKDPGQLPDPWNDKPLFSVSAQNMGTYADKLTEGQKALMKQYPGFRMDIYPTRRTALYPKYVLDNTLKNATSCKTTKNEMALQGCYGGFLFPLPKTGAEVMWNHITRPLLFNFEGSLPSYAVDSKGGATLQAVNPVYFNYPLLDPARTSPNKENEVYANLRVDAIAPARVVGQKYTIIDSIDFVNVGRRSFIYVPGQRRVKLAPDLAYDTPSPGSGGSSTMDEAQIFYGAPDRYDFRLVGKQEKYIMYNNYKMIDGKGSCPNEKILTKNFLNPDCVRWELHRVWVVEAKLKSGFRHQIPKRMFYFDEDTVGAGTSDDYDASGQMYRIVNGTHWQMYNTADGTGVMSPNFTTYDLHTGIYYAGGISSCSGCGLWQEKPKPATFYSPEALAGEGIR